MYIGIANRIFSPFGLSVFSPDQVASLALWLDASQNVFTGGARQFTAADKACFDLGDKTVFEVGDIDAWWAGWVYFDSLGTNRSLFSKYDTGANQREWNIFYQHTSTDIRLVVTGDGGSGATVSVAAGTPSTGQWNFVFAYHDSVNNVIAASLNGGSFTTTAFSAGIFTGTAKAGVGTRFNNGTPGEFHDGRLSRLAMGKSPTGGIAALAETIRDSLYNNAQGKTYAELTASEVTDWGVVWYANCNEGAYDDDLIDNHSTNDGTLLALELLSNTGFETVTQTYGARGFDGSTQYFEHTDDTDFETGDIDFWCAGWVYLDSTAASQVMFGKWLATGDQREWLLLYSSTSSTFRLAVTSDGTTGTQTNLDASIGTPSTGQWYFVVGYHDAASNLVGISVNGGAFATAAYSAGVFAGTGKFAVAAHTGNTSLLDGRLSRLAFGKSPGAGIASLATTIRDALYNSGKGLLYAGLSSSQKTDWGLVEYWNADETTAASSLVGDHAANTISGTGSPTVEADMGPQADFGTWTEVLSGTATINLESVVVDSGTYSARVDGDGSGNVYIRQTVSGAVQGNYYTCSLRSKISGSGGAVILGGTGVTVTASADWQTTTGTNAWGANSLLQIRTNNNTGVCTAYYDTVSLKAAGFLPVNGPSSALVTDSSGNDLHGTLTGFTAAQQIESWRADAGQLVLDVTSNKNHASPINLNTIDAYSTDRPSVFGSGYSLRLNSTQSEYLSIFPHSALAQGTSDRTISCWFKTSTSGSQVSLVDTRQDVTGNGGMLLMINSDGTIRLQWISSGVNSGAAVQVDSASTCTDGAWHHAAGVADRDGNLTLYIDGASTGTPVSISGGASNNIPNTVNYAIGYKAPSGSGLVHFNGLLYDVRIYQSALTSGNISTLNSGGNVSGAAGQWNFSEGPGSGYSLLHTAASSNYENLPATATVAGQAQVTIAGWVKLTALTASSQSLWAEATSSSGFTRINLNVTSTGTVNFGFRESAVDPAGSSAGITTTNVLTNGGWFHLAGVYDSTNDVYRVYINGKSISEDTTARGALGSSTSVGIHIGNVGGGSLYLNGRADSIRVYTTALTADQIMQLAEGSEPTGATGLKGQWDFDDGPFSEPGDGEPILGWQDRKAGKLFQQSTSTKRPTYTLQDADFNSNPSLTFDGTDDLLALADAYLFDTAGTVMIVFKQVTTGDAEDFFASADDATTTKNLAIGQRTAAYGITQNDAGTADTVYGGTTPDTTTHLLTVSTSGTAYTVRLDGVAESLTAGSGTNSGDWFGDTSARDNMTIGARKTSSESNQANVKIAEILVYSEQLTGDDLTNAEAYLIEKYAI